VVQSDWFLHGLERLIISYPRSEGVNKWHHGEPGSGLADDVHNYKLIHMWDTIYFRLRWISRTLAFGRAVASVWRVVHDTRLYGVMMTAA
jgi:hypothetical protein